MGVFDSLQELSLSNPLISSPLKQQFLHEVFRTNSSLHEIENTDRGYQAFFSRFDSLRNAAANRHRAIDSCTFADFFWVVNVLRSNNKPRRELEKAVAERLDKDINHSSLESVFIDFAASVWSLVIIGRSAAYNFYDDPIAWEASMFLHPGLNNQQPNLINTVFSPPSFLDTVKLPQSFTAANLEKIGGIQVLWTDNLADHLLLRDDDTKVMLFHHVSALRLQYYSLKTPIQDLADETIRSMALLIPPTLGAASPWFEQQQQEHHLDSEAGLCDRLNSSERQIDKFHYWRERLVLLKRTYDDAEPKNLSQLWWDDRKKTQWFTFWVAVLVFIMTVFFGVIQSVASIVQAWASVKSLKAQD
ncbi:MAG: hypothetical protein Q9199_005775 [Rusavskia elegans]